jgi:hypothetical protein
MPQSTDAAIEQCLRDGLTVTEEYRACRQNDRLAAKWVPNTDLPVAKKAVRHINYDPRLSPAVLKTFDSAEDDILKNTLQGRIG